MFWLTIIIILALVGAAALIYGLATRNLVAIGIVAIVVVVGGVFTLFNSITTVDARAVGIQTAFGRYSGTLDNGFHFKAPYSSVEQFSTQVQYLDLNGEGDAVPVTFKGGGGGAVNATVRWRIDQKGAEGLWQKYRTFDAVKSQLVTSSAKDSFRVVASNYTPNDARSGENIRPITDAVVKDLTNNLSDDGVVIDSVSIAGIALDSNSQASLDKIVSANNDVQRAQAEQDRAKIDAQTAQIRQQSGALTPDALTRYCLELVNAWDVNKNGPLPATFNCGLNSTTVSPVLPIK